MLTTRLTSKDRRATVKIPNTPTKGTGPSATLHPFLSRDCIGRCVEHLDTATLADPKSCPNIGDHRGFLHNLEGE